MFSTWMYYKFLNIIPTLYFFALPLDIVIWTWKCWLRRNLSAFLVSSWSNLFSNINVTWNILFMCMYAQSRFLVHVILYCMLYIIYQFPQVYLFKNTNLTFTLTGLQAFSGRSWKEAIWLVLVLPQWGKRVYV